MRYLILLLITAINSVTSYSQLPDTLWTRTYPQFDDSCYYLPCIAPTMDNGYVLVGYFCNDSTDGILLKADQTGDLQWTSDFHFTPRDELWDAVGATDGSIFACGSIHGDSDSDGVFVAKYHVNGDTDWTYLFNQSRGYTQYFASRTTDDDFLVAGTLELVPQYPWPGLIKISSSGEPIFARNYPHPFWNRIAYVVGIANSWDQGAVICTYIYRPGIPTRPFLYLIRTNSEGDTLWTRTMGFWDEPIGLFPGSICQADSQSYMVAASVQYGHVDSLTHLTLLKFSDQGDTLWTRSYEFPPLINHLYGHFPQITRDSDGGYVVTATLSNPMNPPPATEALLFKTDSEGNLLWWGTLGDPWILYQGIDIAVAADHSYLWSVTRNVPFQVLRLYADTTGVSIIHSEFPTQFRLEQSYPNPFNSATQISFELSKNTHIELSIMNTLGQNVATLVNENRNAGRYAVPWEASGMASGIYFAQLRAGEQSRVVKMMLVK